MTFREFLENDLNFSAMDATDPLDVSVMKDFIMDNPEEKEQLWTALIAPLIPLDEELEKAYEDNWRAWEYLSRHHNEAGHREAAGAIFTRVGGSLKRYASRQDALKNWEATLRNVFSLYRVAKSMLYLLNDKSVTRNMRIDVDKTREASQKIVNILDNYRKTRFKRSVRPKADVNSQLIKVMGRLFQDGIQVRTLHPVQNWMDTKDPNEGRKALRSLSDRMSYLGTGNELNPRARRDLQFVYDLIKRELGQ
jgi:hypothetical protein